MDHNTRLSSSEIGGLWSTYQQEKMSVCFLTYFLHHTQDNEVKNLISDALDISQSHINQIEELFIEENIPIPHGFSDHDIDLSVPPLFHEEFGLSFVYGMSRMGMITYSFITSSVARKDVRAFFTSCLNESTTMYNESTTLMLSKGIYDRPPMLNYPKHVEYIQEESIFSGYLSKKRPLSALELTEIFLNIERNYFGLLICMGFIQVVKDEEIKRYLINGKHLCEKQIQILNKILIDEGHLGTVPVTMQVTDSNVSPFSDKLIVFLFHTLNSLDITLIGHGLSMSMRTDLTTIFSRLIGEILVYGKEGFDIMVKRRWLEQPPQ